MMPSRPRLRTPALSAYISPRVARRRGVSGNVYMVYEVAYVKPTHYESAPKETGLPRTLRVDFLRRIDESWGSPEGWLENWIEIVAVYTGYVIVEDGEGSYFYEWRPSAAPLIGSEAYILSEDALTRLVSAPEGSGIFTLKDADVTVSLDLEDLVKYHVGVFGFTGGGKSNLTAFMIRRLLEEFEDLIVLHYNEYNPIKSRLKAKWVYYLRQENGDLKYLGQSGIDLRLYSIHEVVNMLERAGWRIMEVLDNLRENKEARFDSPINIIAKKV